MTIGTLRMGAKTNIYVPCHVSNFDNIEGNFDRSWQPCWVTALSLPPPPPNGCMLLVANSYAPLIIHYDKIMESMSQDTPNTGLDFIILFYSTLYTYVYI